MKNTLFKRIISLLLVLTMVCGFALPAGAVRGDGLEKLSYEVIEGVYGTADPSLIADEPEEEEPPYEDDEIVRVSLVLEGGSTLEAGFSTLGIAENGSAMAYRQALKEDQTQVTARVEKAIGGKLDVQWNLTLAANLISANVAYGQIDEIEAVQGVREVVIENRYEPCVVEDSDTAQPQTSTSVGMIGTTTAYATGYTGAGSKVAIIDTGADMDHQSFSAAGYEYSMGLLAEEAGMTLDEYMQAKGVMTTEDIAQVFDQLNASIREDGLNADKLYQSSKIPYGFNYIDGTSSYIDHNRDSQGGHGSHVAGIAAANSYVPGANGWELAVETALAAGVAPDAQLVVMKVFGRSGGAYESDYMAAIEDAIILGCDSVNLSLGQAAPGQTYNTAYESILNLIVESDTLVTISAGNAGHWADAATSLKPGYLYADDVNMHTSSEPSTYINPLGVASVDNVGGTGYYMLYKDRYIFYTEGNFGSQKPLHQVAGDYEFVFIDGLGTEEEFAALADVLKGKVAFCSRGDLSFVEKGENAVKYGAAATVIYNNAVGTLNMDLTEYTREEPLVAITQDEGAYIRENAVPVTDDSGNVLYYTGTIHISKGVDTFISDNEYYTMSSFSSYGVPGDLTMKPEITAPGGNIYSVDGEIEGGRSYVGMSGTSMAAPQVAGMGALVGQFVRENGLARQEGLHARTLIQSLLMSTAEPIEESAGAYYSILRQGSGLANVGSAVTANSYILMGSDATDSWADGKVKVELGHDPERSGVYEFSFTLNNLNDDTQAYVLSADLFTQAILVEDGVEYLDNATAGLNAAAQWTVDGKTLEPDEDVSLYDFNGDGLVNTGDVQALLDYAVGSRESITNESLADFSGDGTQSTYDAYLLLDKLNTGLVTLEPYGSVTVQVKLSLTGEQKEALDRDYPKGAYLEGYIFARQLTTAEGVVGTSHSIPLLGFYGDWSDPSMFDHGSYTTLVYGDELTPYCGPEDRNTMILRYYGDDTYSYYSVGNPYMAEDEYPAGREAIGLRTIVNSQMTSLIRNTTALTMFVTNQDGEYLYAGEPVVNELGAWYYAAGGAWQANNTGWNLYRKVSTFGVSEGDYITFTFVAIPELYGDEDGLTLDQIKHLYENDLLGEGCYLSHTYKVDNRAPEMLSLAKDEATGNLVVETSDDNYVAAIEVRDKGGNVYATVCPEQTEPGQTTTTVIDMSEARKQLGEDIIVVVGDYAKNETAYTFTYNGEREEIAGRIYGYTDNSYRGAGPRWITIEPENVWYEYEEPEYNDGVETVSTTDIDVIAGDYAGGYVYTAASDGYIYVAQHEDWANYQKLCYWKDSMYNIRDMAFNYTDGKFYILAGQNSQNDNVLYRLDPSTGALEKVAALYTSWPATELVFTMMTIDDEGNFYGVTRNSCLFKFDLSQIRYGAIMNMKALGGLKYSPYMTTTHYGSLAWDHDNDVLYMAACITYMGGWEGRMYTINPETCEAIGTCTTYPGDNIYAVNRLAVCVHCLYVVPSETVELEPAEEAVSIVLNKTGNKGLPGAQFTLETVVYPWSLKDKSINWESDDPSIATVDGNGVVTLVKPGTTTITATTNAPPYLSATCKVTVEQLPGILLSALVTDESGSSQWVEFESDRLSKVYTIADSESYLGGGLAGDTVYLNDGQRLYGVDADSFQVSDMGPLAEGWTFLSAADCPAMEDDFGGFVAITTDGYFAMVRPDSGVLRYWNLTSVYSASPAVAVAYKGEGVATYGSYTDCPAHYYYIINEDGQVSEFAIAKYMPDDPNAYVWVKSSSGSTGLVLDGVGNLLLDRSAALVYDEFNDYLLLALSMDGETTQLYGINPETFLAGSLGTISGVAGVQTMYQYQRETVLNIKMSSKDESLFVGESLQLVAGVVPVSYDGAMIWESSDESVATVDENGVVTGVSEGQVTITATSVAVDHNGKPATAQCDVTVRQLVSVDTQVNAQVVTDDGPKWVTIDTGELTYTEFADANVTLSGGGVHEGRIYGSDVDTEGNVGSLFLIEPAKNYREYPGSQCVITYAPLDMAAAPRTDVVLADHEGKLLERTAFGHPILLTYSGWFGFLVSFSGGSLSGWDWSIYDEDLAAVAYAGDTLRTNENGEVKNAKSYYLLDADGTLSHVQIEAVYYAEAADGLSYQMTRTEVGNVGLTFDAFDQLTMTAVEGGLMVGYNDVESVGLYYIDLTGDTIRGGKVGELEGVSALTAMYTDEDLYAVAPNTAEANGPFASSPVSFAAERPVAQMAQEFSLVADQTAGSTNSVQPMAVQPDPGCTEDVVELTLTADRDSTNGLITVEYDESVMTLVKTDLAAAYTSVVESEGKVTFGYVNDTAIAQGDVIAVLTFEAAVQTLDTTVTVTTAEDSDTMPGTAEEVALTGPGHDWGEWTVVEEAGCQTEGLKQRACLDCGEIGTEVIPAWCPSEQFDDVDTTRWYHEAIDFVVKQGLMNGTAANIFAPDGTMTRAQLVTVLYRLAGSPQVEGELPFDDLEENRYYSDAVIWAYANGIAKGMTDDAFAPDAPVTREQMVTFFARYAVFTGKTVEAKGDLSAYTDAGEVHNYARENMTWAVESGLIKGMTDTTLAPQGTATRAQVATVLMRFCQLLG